MSSNNYLIIFAVFFAILMVVGYVANRRSTNYEDFTVGGKEVKWYAIGSSMSTGLFGASSLMTSVFYARIVGVSSVWLIFLPTLIGLILLAVFMAKKIRNLGIGSGIYSISEMMNEKYGNKVRLVYVIIIIISLIALAVANCIAMSKVISYYCDIDRNTIMLIGTVLCTLFVLIGGFRGISATSVLQASLMVFAIIAVGIASIHAGGGFSSIHQASMEIPEFNSLFSSGFPLSAAIGWVLCMGFPVITSQDLHQKIISCKSEKDVSKAIVLAVVIVIILYGCGTIAGYSSIAWDLGTSEAADSEYFIAWASEALFGPVMTTIIAIGFVAAINTTLASVLSAASFSISRDLVYYYQKSIDEKKLLKITKFSVVGVAIASYLIAAQIPDILTAMYLTGNIMAGGLTLPIFAYFFSKKVTAEGVFVSSIVGTAFVLFDFVLRQAGVALPWPGEPVSIIITFVLSTVILAAVSALTQKKHLTV